MTNPPSPDGSVAKELTTDKAEQMAEVALINNDLNTCIRSLNVIKQRYLADDLSNEDTDIKLALFRDAINLYVDAFRGSGFKLKVSDVYSGEGFEEFFQWARDVRVSYAAHSFGPMRQCAAVVAVDPTTGKATGVGPVRLDLDIVVPEVVSELAKAATIASKYAAQLGSKLNDELLQEALAMSPDELAALHPARLHIPKVDEYRMARSAFRAIKSGAAKPPRKRRRRPD